MLSGCNRNRSGVILEIKTTDVKSLILISNMTLLVLLFAIKLLTRHNIFKEIEVFQHHFSFVYRHYFLFFEVGELCDVKCVTKFIFAKNKLV